MGRLSTTVGSLAWAGMAAGCVPGWCNSAGDCRPDETCAWDRRCVARDGSSDGEFFSLFPDTPPGADAGSTACSTDSGEPLTPERVYLLGSLTEDTCRDDALADVMEPGRVTLGFPCTADQLRLRSDGSLLYVDAAGNVRRMERDSRAWRSDLGACALTADAESNDNVVPVPGCTVEQMWAFPGTSELLVACSEAPGEWRLSDGTAVDTAGRNVVAVGTGGSVLLKPPATSGLVRLEAGVATTVTGLSGAGFFTVVAGRASGTGFNVAVEASNTVQLWHVDDAARASLVGVYPPLPVSIFTIGDAVLDGGGALFQLGFDGTDDVVVRRQPGGANAAVVYANVRNPTVRINLSVLVTGP